MNSHHQQDYEQPKQQVERETDAEIVFGRMLENAGVDCDAFMENWHINQHQFNHISHYLYGLTEDLAPLPPAIAVLLAASRQQRPLAA